MVCQSVLPAAPGFSGAQAGPRHPAAPVTCGRGSTDVEADSNETVNSTAIAGGVGAVGVAGAIAVVNLSSATSATIVDSNVNQNTSYYYSARLALINFTKSTNLISHQWFREDRAWMFKRSEI